MVGVGLTVLAVVAFSSSLVNYQRLVKLGQVMDEVASMRKMVLENLDCAATLGVTPTTVLPLNCAAYPTVIPKAHALATGAFPLIAPGGQIGAWTVTAGCNDRRLRFRATRPGLNPIGLPYSQEPEFTKDLFEGTSDLCREYFSAPKQAKTVCAQSSFSLPFPAVSIAFCEPGWRAVSGGCLLVPTTPWAAAVKEVSQVMPGVIGDGNFFCGGSTAENIVVARAVCCQTVY